jgi:hypothetical protein
LTGLKAIPVRLTQLGAKTELPSTSFKGLHIFGRQYDYETSHTNRHPCEGKRGA